VVRVRVGGLFVYYDPVLGAVYWKTLHIPLLTPNWAGSYILASNTVEFNTPTYLGLYPSFLVLQS